MAAAVAPPAWKLLLQKSVDANKHLKHSSYVQLATVTPEGKPANRTVVYRGFLGDTARVQFYTDTRSSKVEEIKHNPWAEVCMYFTDTWEQFRLLGCLHAIGPDDADQDPFKAREEAWFGTSERQRVQFANPPPGRPRAPEEDFPKAVDGAAGPLPAFALLVLSPVQVDYLHLKENKRILYRLTGGGGAGEEWAECAVNP